MKLKNYQAVLLVSFTFFLWGAFAESQTLIMGSIMAFLFAAFVYFKEKKEKGKD